MSQVESGKKLSYSRRCERGQILRFEYIGYTSHVCTKWEYVSHWQLCQIFLDFSDFCMGADQTMDRWWFEGTDEGYYSYYMACSGLHQTLLYLPNRLLPAVNWTCPENFSKCISLPRLCYLVRQSELDNDTLNDIQNALNRFSYTWWNILRKLAYVWGFHSMPAFSCALT